MTHNPTEWIEMGAVCQRRRLIAQREAEPKSFSVGRQIEIE